MRAPVKPNGLPSLLRRLTLHSNLLRRLNRTQSAGVDPRITLPRAIRIIGVVHDKVEHGSSQGSDLATRCILSVSDSNSLRAECVEVADPHEAKWMAQTRRASSRGSSPGEGEAEAATESSVWRSTASQPRWQIRRSVGPVDRRAHLAATKHLPTRLRHRPRCANAQFSSLLLQMRYTARRVRPVPPLSTRSYSSDTWD